MNLKGHEAVKPRVMVERPFFDLKAILDEIEASLIMKVLERTNGVQTRAAELLGISFRQLRYLVHKHGLRLRPGKYR